MTRKDPIRPTDDAARALARRLLHEARFAALAYLTEAGTPSLARVTLGLEAGCALMLVSDLAAHARALAVRPECALLLGEPGERGDPLTHPRLTVEGRVEPVAKTAERRAAWLATHPKAQLYVDFADFRFLAMRPARAFLNAGFGKAYRLAPEDLDS